METKEKHAKLFLTGRSQAVRLPKEFRFSGTEVRVRKAGNAVILEPVGDDWSWVDMWREKYGPVGTDFVAAVNEKTPAQERPEVDRYFAQPDKRVRGRR